MASFRDSPETNPSKIRIRNPDGTVNIHCRNCGRFICRTTYTGFSTALCEPCQSGNPRPLFSSPQEELLQQIYSEIDQTSTIEYAAKPKKKFSLIDMAINTVKALGFRRKIEEPIDINEVEYKTSDKETSKQVAKRKKRTPIFKRKNDE